MFRAPIVACLVPPKDGAAVADSLGEGASASKREGESADDVERVGECSSVYEVKTRYVALMSHGASVRP